MKIRRVLLIVFSILLALVSSFVIYYGIQLNQKMKAPILFQTFLKDSLYEIKDYIDGNYIDFGNDFSLNGSVSFQLSSDYYLLHQKENEKYLSYHQLIQNLSQLQTNYTLSHSNRDKELYFKISQELKGETLLHHESYVKNATYYYLTKPYVQGFIDGGSSHYFETITNDTYVKDHDEYLFSQMLEAFSSSIPDDYYKEYQTNIQVEGKEIKARQISLELDSAKIKKIRTSAMKKIQKDEKTMRILGGVGISLDYLFPVDSLTKTYTINLYLSPLKGDFLKVEIVALDSDQRKVYSYEDGLFQCFLNDQLIFSLEGSFKDNKMDYKIYNSSHEEVGYFQAKQSDDLNSLSLSYNNQDHMIDVNCDEKNMDTGGTSYQHQLSCDLRWQEKTETKISGHIEKNETISNTPIVLLEIERSRLEKSLTEEEKNTLSTVREVIKQKLMGS